MNLANILLDDSPTFPTFPNSGNLSPNNYKDLAIKRFVKGFRSYVGGGLNIYVGEPEDEVEILKDYILLNFSTIQFYDNNHNGIYDSISDKKVTDIDVYISHDGVYLLEQFEAISESIEKDRIAIFLEIPKGDVISETVLYVLAGGNAVKFVSYLFSNKNFD